jgi:hypothetical protein
MAELPSFASPEHLSDAHAALYARRAWLSVFEAGGGKAAR